MPALAPITIAGLAAKTGIDIESIRTYERMGLIEKPRRGPGGYLLYWGQDVEILTFIRRASSVGFSLPAIRDLLGLAQPRSGACWRRRSLRVTGKTIRRSWPAIQSVACSASGVRSISRGG